jgi:hypothetical protein
MQWRTWHAQLAKHKRHGPLLALRRRKRHALELIRIDKVGVCRTRAARQACPVLPACRGIAFAVIIGRALVDQRVVRAGYCARIARLVRSQRLAVHVFQEVPPTAQLALSARIIVGPPAHRAGVLAIGAWGARSERALRAPATCKSQRKHAAYAPCPKERQQRPYIPP